MLTQNQLLTHRSRCFGFYLEADSKGQRLIRMPKTSKHQVIVATWERLNRPSVGANELKVVLKALAKSFSDTTSSPASVARVLADEGAELRHPEVLEYDARWRSQLIATEAKQFASLERWNSSAPLSLDRAVELFAALESLRNRFEKESNSAAIQKLREFATEVLRTAEALTKDRASDQQTGETQKEIAAWLKVWLQTPALFADWLELRRRAPEFGRRFLEKPKEN